MKYDHPMVTTCDEKLCAISHTTKKVAKFPTLEKLDRFAEIWAMLHGKDSITRI